MNKYNDLIIKNIEFENIIKDIICNETVLQMLKYRQHYDTTCFDHCMNVAYYSYLICRKYNLDYVSAARAGMLHDLFLYDWREKKADNRKGLHAFTHPKTAFFNASKIFCLTQKEQDIILKHMWPLTIYFPRYIESLIVSFVDKYCAIEESFHAYSKNRRIRKMERFVYLFLSFFAINIL